MRGLGTLVPENVLWIPAENDGRVSKINVHAGAPVRPGTIILELENPDVKLAAVNAEYDMKAAEANLIDLPVKLESQSFDQNRSPPP